MNQLRYVADLSKRLRAQGFKEEAVPPGGLSLTLGRQEAWGNLILALAPLDMLSAAQQEAQTHAVATWVRRLQEESGGIVRAILVFGFTASPASEDVLRIQGLRQEEDAWGVLPWVADLEVGLIDQHSGPPPVNPAIAQAITNLPDDERVRVQRTHFTRTETTFTSLLSQVPGTRIILALTVAVYIGDMFMSQRVLYMCCANITGRVLQQGEHWRLLTHLFLHDGLLHIGMNMWAFWSLGRHVEMIFGSWRMLFIYFMSGVVGGVASALLRSDFITSVGASGAVFGLFGALLYFTWAQPRRFFDWRELIRPIAINLMFGFFVPFIDNQAHVGGLVGGFVAAFLVGAPGERQSWRQALLLLVSVALLGLLLGLIRLPHVPLFS